MRIPNKIHFIWVGTPLPHHLAENLVAWVHENPLYTISLWTEFQKVEEVAISISEYLLRRLSQSTPEERLTVSITPSEPHCQVAIKKNDTIISKLYIKTISILFPITDPNMLAEEMTTWRNYGAASDILRLWILYAEGGIYFDLDIYSSGTPLPINIFAPRCFLIGYLHLDVLYPCNSILAVPAGSHKIYQLAKFIEQNYEEHKYTKTERPGVFTLPDEARTMLQTVATMREERAQATDDSERLTEIRKRFRKSYGEYTISNSGPTALTFWFIVTENITLPFLDADLYSFEAQAPCKLRIESDWSWMK